METRAASGWSVLLIGGHSGAGKSMLAMQIARHFGVAYAEADDFRMALQQVTTAAEHPDLHFFITAPGVAKDGIWEASPEELADRLLRVGQVVSHALEVVVAHHQWMAKPLILEGDGILPRLAIQSTFPTKDGEIGRARFVLLHEPDVDYLLSSMIGRGQGYQTQARMYWLYGQWLRREAEWYGLPIIEARPYSTLLERVLAVTGEPISSGNGNSRS